jgi:lipid-binding SYLF domain-containing protein
MRKSGHGDSKDVASKSEITSTRKEDSVMKKAILFAAFASLSLSGVARAATSREATEARLQHAGEVLHEVMSAPDKGIPEEVLQHAKCIAVVPHLVKGGFVFGAEGGRGVATCRTENGWSAPAFFSITGGNWGLQIGVEGIDLVMVFQGDQGMDRLVKSKFEIGADATVAAGPVGRHASADTDWKMNAEILTYSRAKGIFAGITLNGASVRRDDDSTAEFYGREIPTRDLLMGQVPPPPGSGAFLDAIHDAKVQAKANR